MDILGLPDVFLHMLMRKMKIRDRKMMRLTCRAFEKLVAESHAGYFADGFIAKAFPEDPDSSTLRLVIGDQKFNDSKEAGLEKFLHIRSRLFTGITIGVWEFRLSGTPLTSEFLNAFADKLRADKFIFQVDTTEHYDFALEYAAKFPGSKFMMDVGFLPSIDQLRALPALEELQITTPARNRIGFSPRYDRSTQITGDLFFELLDSHKNLYLDNVLLSSGEWERALQIISDDSTERMIQVGVKRSTIAKWMKSYGITKRMQAGDVKGEFTIISEMPSRMMVELRYRQCTIWVERFDWTSGELPVLVELQNASDPWQFMAQPGWPFLR